MPSPACRKRSRRLPANAIFRETLSTALQSAGAADAALCVLTGGIALTPGGIVLRNAAILLCLRRRDFAQANRLADDAPAPSASRMPAPSA